VNTALIRRDLLESLKADPEYRHAWNLENVYTGVCFQIRALREQREWSQAALGKAAKMAPERISILEDPNADTKPTLNTLLRIANACDVGLDVRFVPYGTVVERSIRTDLRTLEVPSFFEELPELERSIDAALAAPSYEILTEPAGTKYSMLREQYTGTPGASQDYRIPHPACAPERQSAVGHYWTLSLANARNGVASSGSEDGTEQNAKSAEIVDIEALRQTLASVPRGVFPDAGRDQERARHFATGWR